MVPKPFCFGFLVVRFCLTKMLGYCGHLPRTLVVPFPPKVRLVVLVGI